MYSAQHHIVAKVALNSSTTSSIEFTQPMQCMQLPHVPRPPCLDLSSGWKNLASISWFRRELDENKVFSLKTNATSDICHFFYTNITHNIMQIILMMRLVLIMMTLAMMMTVLVIMMLVVTTCHREWLLLHFLYVKVALPLLFGVS